MSVPSLTQIDTKEVVIVRRNDVDYERTTITYKDGSEAVDERVVTKASYTRPIEAALERVSLLQDLRDACVE